jgi:hypothetical protein
MGTEKSILAAERAKQELAKEKEVKEAAKKRLRPSVVQVAVTWPDDDGIEQSATLPIRVLNFDERNQAVLLASTLASGRFNMLPESHAEFLMGISHIFTMWPAELPQGLQNRLHEDELLVAQIYGLIEQHRAARFRGDRGEGKIPQAKARLVDPPPSVD